jgi:hypothetical protein
LSAALVEELPDEPYVPERVGDGALEHSPNRMGSKRLVRVFLHGAAGNRSGGDRTCVDGNGIVHEQLDPDGRETHGRWTARAMRGRLMSEEERGAVNGHSSNDVPSPIQVPEERRAERRLVKGDRGVPVADGQHGRDLSLHRVDPER